MPDTALHPPSTPRGAHDDVGGRLTGGVLRPGEALAVVCAVGLASVVSLRGPAPWPAVRAGVALLAAGLVLAGGRRTAAEMALAMRVPLGLGGLIVGAGIGLPRAIVGSMSPVAVTAVVAAGAGAALLVRTGIELVRRAGRRGRIAAVPLCVAVAVFVVFPLTLAVCVTNVAPIPAGRHTPADVGLPFGEVSITTADGVRLAAWYVPSTNHAAVVLLGGATSTRADELDHAGVLARHGYGVLLLDERGHGDSGGDAMLWGWHGDLDVHAGIDYLASLPDLAGGRVGAVGMSMGAEEAIGAAGSDPRILAVVAEGATGRGPRDEGDAARGVGGLLTRYTDWAATRAADLMTSAPQPAPLRRSVAAAPARTMLIAAGTKPSEIAAAHALRDRAPDRVAVWVAAGAGHTTAYDTDPAGWEARVTSFLDGNLRPGTATSGGTR